MKSSPRRKVGVPVLNKDFIIDERQIDRAYLYGADVILLIVAALDDHRRNRSASIRAGHQRDAEADFEKGFHSDTGAHKINNTIGQALLTKRMGKKKVVAETGAGQHGVATATVCALLDLECVVFMGKEDVKRQELNVFRMELLGAKVVSVDQGRGTLKDAVNEALRYWACIGGGSNAIGMFHPFIEEHHHQSQTVLHGAKMHLLQDIPALESYRHLPVRKAFIAYIMAGDGGSSYRSSSSTYANPVLRLGSSMQ